MCPRMRNMSNVFKNAEHVLRISMDACMHLVCRCFPVKDVARMPCSVVGLPVSLPSLRLCRPAAGAAERGSSRATFRRHAVSARALNLTGKWVKDQENSDLKAYGDMLSLLGLSGIRKTGALKLINALIIEQCSQDPQFTVRYVVSKVQFLKSVEQFSLNRSVEMPRRDGQKGVQSASMTEDDSQVQTVVTWGEPNPVILTETYRQLASGALVTEAVIEAQGKKLRCKQVYDRST